MTTVIKLATARELIDAGSVRNAGLIGQPGGYAVLLRYGMQERVIGTKAGTPRIFSRLEAAAKLLRELGIVRFDVDAANYAPGDVTRTRPDRQAALREVHRAAAHDQWFRDQVQAAVAKEAAGESQFHEEADTFAELEAYAASKAGRH